MAVKTIWDAIGGFLKVESLIIGTTSRCQLDCLMCADKEFPEITFDEYKKIVEWAHGQYDEVIPDGNGEPLLHPDIIEMTKLAPTSIVTNGELLTPDMVENLTLRELRVSIDGGDKETHEKIRVHGNFDRVVENVRYAAKKFPTTVFSVLTCSNVVSLLRLPDILKDLGVKKWVIWDCQDYGNELGRADGLSYLGKKWADELRMVAEGKIPLCLHDGDEPHVCMAPKNQIYVHSNGDLSPCCIADDFVFGNYKSMSWEEARQMELGLDLFKVEGRHKRCRDWLGRAYSID